VDRADGVPRPAKPARQTCRNVSASLETTRPPHDSHQLPRRAARRPPRSTVREVQRPRQADRGKRSWRTGLLHRRRHRQHRSGAAVRGARRACVRASPAAEALALRRDRACRAAARSPDASAATWP